MRFTFFGQDDKILFFRDDAEEAVFAHEQYRLTATFPYDPQKVIECGQRIGYTDLDGVFQVFEVRQPKSTLPDNAQSIDCEHIAMAELSDEYNEELVASTTAVNAVTSTLDGSMWVLGTTITTGNARKSLSYMTKWEALCAIRDKWNVRYRFRVTVGSAGITGRYVDIQSNVPVYRGVRLTLDRNVDNIGVTYDDRYCYTAMYGRGKGQSTLAGDDENAAKITFDDVVWTTPTNPANKPSGQKWVEDATAKAAYGRNGRNRFGYHDFTEIDDPAELLQATWNYLQTTNAPRITFDMSVYDLSAYGYAGERLYLGDAVYVIIDPFGIRAEATVVQLSQDLLHPERTKPVIGNYRADITYINRDTSASAAKADEMASANPDLLNGIINTMVTAIMSSGTTMYTDESDGSLVFESADGIKAVRITGGGILLASAKTDGAWVWRTAVTGTGIVADEVTTGTLRAALVTILGNEHFYWDSANIYAIDPTNEDIQIRLGLYDGTHYGLAYTDDGGTTWKNKIDFSGATFSHAFSVINALGEVLLSVTEADDATGEAGGVLKIGNVQLDSTIIFQPVNGGTGYASGQTHRVTAPPADTLGIDGDIAVFYNGSTGAYSAISPTVGSGETTSRFGKTRIWNNAPLGGYVGAGNTGVNRYGAYWTFATPAVSPSTIALQLTAGKLVGGAWYGWNTKLPLTVEVYPSLSSTTPLATATFVPANNPDAVSVSLSFGSALAQETTYYIAMFDPSESLNKSRAVVRLSSVVIPGSDGGESYAMYIKDNGQYRLVTSAVSGDIADHIADDDNPHGVTYAQTGAAAADHTHSAYVPTSRTVNGHALTSNVSVTLSDVGGAAATHAHGNVTSDGKIGTNADQFVMTGIGGGLTVGSPGVARTTMDAQQTIAYGATSPASPFTGQIWLKPKA